MLSSGARTTTLKKIIDLRKAEMLAEKEFGEILNKQIRNAFMLILILIATAALNFIPLVPSLPLVTGGLIVLDKLGYLSHINFSKSHETFKNIMKNHPSANNKPREAIERMINNAHITFPQFANLIKEYADYLTLSQRLSIVDPVDDGAFIDFLKWTNKRDILQAFRRLQSLDNNTAALQITENDTINANTRSLHWSFVVSGVLLLDNVHNTLEQTTNIITNNIHP